MNHTSLENCQIQVICTTYIDNISSPTQLPYTDMKICTLNDDFYR